MTRHFAVAAALLSALAFGGCAHFARHEAFVPVRIIQTVPPVFPMAMERRDINQGNVQVMISVDANGVLVDRLLLGYSRASFAKEALEALHQWRFEPARFQGEPIASRLEVRFDFTRTGQVVSKSGAHAAEQLGPKRDIPATRLVAEEAELDEPLRLEKRVAPELPPGLARALSGRVEVEFFIDGYGRVRMPAVRATDDDRLARAVLVAMSQWRYSDPLWRGERVNVRRREEFVFPAAATDAPPENPPSNGTGR